MIDTFLIVTDGVRTSTGPASPSALATLGARVLDVITTVIAGGGALWDFFLDRIRRQGNAPKVILDFFSLRSSLFRKRFKLTVKPPAKFAVIADAIDIKQNQIDITIHH